MPEPGSTNTRQQYRSYLLSHARCLQVLLVTLYLDAKAQLPGRIHINATKIIEHSWSSQTVKVFALLSRHFQTLAQGLEQVWRFGQLALNLNDTQGISHDVDLPWMPATKGLEKGLLQSL